MTVTRSARTVHIEYMRHHMNIGFATQPISRDGVTVVTCSEYIPTE